MNLGDKIRKLRKTKDISQEKLAEILNVHITNIGRYETNKQSPSAETVRKLAEYFDVTTDYLLFEESKNISTTKIRDKELLGQFEKVEEMETDDRRAVKIILDAMIAKHKIKDIFSTRAS